MRKIIIRHNDGHVILRVVKGPFYYAVYDKTGHTIISDRRPETGEFYEVDVTDEFLGEITPWESTIAVDDSYREIKIHHHSGFVVVYVPVGEFDFWCYHPGEKINEGFVPKGKGILEIDANETIWDVIDLDDVYDSNSAALVSKQILSKLLDKNELSIHHEDFELRYIYLNSLIFYVKEFYPKDRQNVESVLKLCVKLSDPDLSKESLDILSTALIRIGHGVSLAKSDYLKRVRVSLFQKVVATLN